MQIEGRLAARLPEVDEMVACVHQPHSRGALPLNERDQSHRASFPYLSLTSRSAELLRFDARDADDLGVLLDIGLDELAEFLGAAAVGLVAAGENEIVHLRHLQRFADLGLVAIAVEYRLSEGEVTPIEAVDDACAAFA